MTKHSEIKKEMDRISRNKINGQYVPLNGVTVEQRLKSIKEQLSILRPEHEKLMKKNWVTEKDYGSSLELWEYAMNDLDELFNQIVSK